MASDAAGHYIPATTDAPRRSNLVSMQASIRDVVSCTDLTDAASKVSAMAAAGMATSGRIYWVDAEDAWFGYRDGSFFKLRDSAQAVQPRAGAINRFAPDNVGPIPTVTTAKQVYAWVDFGVADFPRIVTMIFGIQCDITTASSTAIINASIHRVNSGTVLGTTFDTTSQTIYQDMRQAMTPALNFYTQLVHTSIHLAGDTSTKYLCVVNRSASGAASTIDGAGPAVYATWQEVAGDDFTAAAGATAHT